MSAWKFKPVMNKTGRMNSALLQFSLQKAVEEYRSVAKVKQTLQNLLQLKAIEKAARRGRRAWLHLLTEEQRDARTLLQKEERNRWKREQRRAAVAAAVAVAVAGLGG